MAKGFMDMGAKAPRERTIIIDALNLGFRWKHQGRTDFADDYMPLLNDLKLELLRIAEAVALEKLYYLSIRVTEKRDMKSRHLKRRRLFKNLWKKWKEHLILWIKDGVYFVSKA